MHSAYITLAHHPCVVPLNSAELATILVHAAYSVYVATLKHVLIVLTDQQVGLSHTLQTHKTLRRFIGVAVQVSDLAPGSKQTALPVRHDKHRGFFVEGLTEVPCDTCPDALTFMHKALITRHIRYAVCTGTDMTHRQNGGLFPSCDCFSQFRQSCCKQHRVLQRVLQHRQLSVLVSVFGCCL